MLPEVSNGLVRYLGLVPIRPYIPGEGRWKPWEDGAGPLSSNLRSTLPVAPSVDKPTVRELPARGERTDESP